MGKGGHPLLKTVRILVLLHKTAEESRVLYVTGSKAKDMWL